LARPLPLRRPGYLRSDGSNAQPPSGSLDIAGPAADPELFRFIKQPGNGHEGNGLAL